MTTKCLPRFVFILLPLLLLTSCKKSPNLLADFSFTYNSPLEVKFESNSPDANTYHWDFGDGDISFAQNPIKRYNKAGTYQVKLEIAKGSKTSFKTKDVEIKATKCYVTRLQIEEIALLSSSMDLYYTMAVSGGNFLQSSTKNWYDGLGPQISNYFKWEYPNRSGQFSQSLDEKSTIKVYWTKQVPTTLLQEIEFDPSKIVTTGTFPTVIPLEKKLNGSTILKLNLYVEWE